MKARFLEKQVHDLKDSKFGRILLFTGARQTGKTTLVKEALKDYSYLSVDDPQLRPVYEKLTAAQWQHLYPKATIDEVQKVPSIIDSIKAVYDQYDAPRYALLGSSQILLLGKIKETLAGRCSVLELFPLTLPELKTTSFADEITPSLFQKILKGELGPGDLPPQFMLDPLMPEKAKAYSHYLNFGGYPAVSDDALTADERRLWLENHTRTYLERDLADLANLRELQPFMKLRQAVALGTGNLLNVESLARQIGITAKTIRRYLQYLSISYQTILLEPWSRNLLRRLTKTPKIHLLDTGILRAILGKSGILSGAEFESALVAEIYKQTRAIPFAAHFSHLRTSDGLEIDLLLETAQGYYAFEMKRAEKVFATDARHLRKLQDILDKPLLHSFVLSNDCETKELAPNITAVHAALFLG